MAGSPTDRDSHPACSFSNLQPHTHVNQRTDLYIFAFKYSHLGPGLHRNEYSNSSANIYLHQHIHTPTHLYIDTDKDEYAPADIYVHPYNDKHTNRKPNVHQHTGH